MKLIPVKKKRIYQDIIEQVKLAIEKGELVPGDKLPSERTLASAMAVSRTSIKEAFSVLESVGVVEIRQGSGMYLLRNRTDDVISKINAIIYGIDADLIELMELRQALEGDAAYYAAIRAGKEDLGAIEEAFRSLELAVSGQSVAAEEDLAFHMAIAKASRNSILEKMMFMVSDQILAGLTKSRTDTLQSPEKSRQILEEHRRIYEAIRHGNAELAKEAMGMHLLKVKQRYL